MILLYGFFKVYYLDIPIFSLSNYNGDEPLSVIKLEP